MFCQRLGSDGTAQITFGGTGKGIDVLDPPQFTANIAVRVAVMIVFVSYLVMRHSLVEQNKAEFKEKARLVK